MSSKISANRSADGIMIFSNGFTDPNLSFSSIGKYEKSNLSKISSKLRVREHGLTDGIDLSAIKTKFFKDNYQIKTSYGNVSAYTSNTTEYYPYRSYNDNLLHTIENFQPSKNSNDSFANRYFENPFLPTPTILFGMNNYRFKYKNKVPHLIGMQAAPEGNENKIEPLVSESMVRPAMFNPLYMISVNGMTNNTPLLNVPNSLSQGPYKVELNSNTTDCSIRELVTLSHNHNSILGISKYKYADFMYCKDLGKVSNNHLITLRVFPYPVGDNIQNLTSPQYITDEQYTYENIGDIGRLVTWFGTDDNKLEDILKYEYNATWKELNAQIEQINSQEDSQDRGPLGMLINTFTPAYNSHVGKGMAGSHSLWKHIGGDRPVAGSIEALGNYDKNKVYEPKDTVQSTHTYEGKLIFTHEFTLNFSYKLRAYDNINPKSAFLDLIGNILAVTYRRGKFWGGSRNFIGPQQNTSAWKKANAIIDGAFSKAGHIFHGLMTGAINLQTLLGCLSGLVGTAEQLVQGAQKLVNNEGAIRKKAEEIINTTNMGSALKGGLKNMLGRPAIYAMQSLLTGDDVGLWHVTIGNPKNPIVTIGNLILTKASISHSGPLGIDDFPTELKVTVTLKHARGRDAVDIQKMYTGGVRAIYTLPQIKAIENYYKGASVIKDDPPPEENNEESETDAAKKSQAQSVNANNTPESDIQQQNIQNEPQNDTANISDIDEEILYGYGHDIISYANKDISINTTEAIDSEAYSQYDTRMLHRAIHEIK